MNLTRPADVFVVDDDPAVGSSLAALIMAHGFDVQLFPSADAFLAACRPQTVGCLLADINLPRMSGLELLDHVSQQIPGLVTIILTGFGNVAGAVRAMKAGALEFIEKPYEAGVILPIIERALTLAKDRHQIKTALAVLEQRLEKLTPRERDIFDHLSKGSPNKVIAFELGISPRTIEVHRTHIMEKMAARNISELIHMALMLQNSH
jgi:FixJ family two-component response regulator